MIVTFEEALCIFRDEQYTEENVHRARIAMQQVFREGLQMVYTNDPKQPMLVHYSKAPLFKPYISKEELSKKLR